MNNKHPNIGNYKDFQQPDESHYPESSELLSIGSPVGKKLGLKKIGVHIEHVPPGRRTSYPHAELDEEEFVYVIDGKIDVWMDGELYPLGSGDFVAFPKATGIAHTFINNYKNTARLLVAGECIEGSRVFYPLNPEQNKWVQERGKLWADYPKKKLGPHNGKPHKT